LHLWIFTFNPFRVGTSKAHFPQVAPVAIHIQPFQGWYLKGTFSTGGTLLFTFNPFRVGTSKAHFPQVALKLFTFNPSMGWYFKGTFPTGGTKAIHIEQNHGRGNTPG
jgi:hypothetical protein